MKNYRRPAYFISLCCLLISGRVFSQPPTNIRGFAEARTTIGNNRLSFALGEQDLFITSELSDRVSFLGESVFRIEPSSATHFAVSIERIVVKYNFVGNHNLLIGKHHTPLNYWNDTYHHGRLFFPTIDRPLLFSAEIIPLHTTGVSMQGHDLGKVKFGYDLMVGNGLGSTETGDNDRHKSWSAAVHIKPAEKLRIGASYYRDIISKGAHIHSRMIDWRVKQQLLSASVAYFGNKFEILAEGTMGINKTDSTGSRHTLASYFYGGYKITDKLIPYFRLDNLDYQEGEVFFVKNNATSVLLGMRFEINYLVVLKLEFQRMDFAVGGISNRVIAQVAIGF